MVTTRGIMIEKLERLSKYRFHNLYEYERRAAASYKYNSGPVAVNTLADVEANLVIVAKLGPGASSMGQHSIRRLLVQPNTEVADYVARRVC